MLFRRKETAWEVVHSCSVEPVPVYYQDDDLDSIVSVKDQTVRRTYILELKKPAKDANVRRKAVLFAQERLLEEVTRNGYNILLLESWTLTLLRKADAHRIQVEYRATPYAVYFSVISRSLPENNQTPTATFHGRTTNRLLDAFPILTTAQRSSHLLDSR